MDFSAVKEMSILPFDTSHTEGRFLVHFNDRYYEVSTSLAALLETAKKCETLSEVALQYSSASGCEYSEADIEAILEKFILPITRNSGKALSQRKGQFLYNIGLLPPKIVRTIASCLKVLYKPVFAWPLLVLIAFCEIFFLTEDLRVIHTLDGADGWLIASVLGLFVLNSFFHEFGHASACRFFGTKTGGIGLGLYITFPVFYTDVTDVWCLTRRQRVIVNIGGVYFQLIFLIPFFVVYFFTGNDICKLYIYATNLNFLLTLNPFLKFDGYWIMSDMAGVPNLRKRTTEYVKYLFNRIRNKEYEKPFLLSLNPVERTLMIVYSIAINAFFLYFFIYMMPKMLWTYVKQLPSDLAHIVETLSNGALPETSMLVSTAIQIFFICFILLFIYRLIAKLIGDVLARNQHLK